MDKNSRLSPDGKWWWDGTTWQPVKMAADLLKGLDKELQAYDAKGLWAFIGQTIEGAGAVTGDKTLAPGPALLKISYYLLPAIHAHILLGRVSGFIGQEEADKQLAIVLKTERAMR
jgi:hypothetical protein